VFTLVIERKAEKFLKNLPEKTRRIIVDKILELREDPFPGGNKEKIEYPHPPVVYRLHIGRSYTIFYLIESDENVIKIEKIRMIKRGS
jgi:mRNA-degrading endonuclease RelE of RelBE toxin-antitoxin system